MASSSAAARRLKTFTLSGTACPPRLELLTRSAAHTGGVIWDSGVILARYLCQMPSLCKGKRVLELGSGTGVAGLTAAACGADFVLLTDLRIGVDLLKENVQHNKLNDRVRVSALEWGNSTHIQHARNVLQESNKRGFDLILGSDVLYDSKQIGHLMSTVDALAAEGSDIFIAAPSKNCRNSNLSHFERIDEFSTPKEEGFRAPGSPISLLHAQGGEGQRLRPGGSASWFWGG